jgi:asparagine N-glycosylation enzyme membrane subunit Stt3
MLFLILTCVLVEFIAAEIAVTSDDRHVPRALLKIIVLGILVRASAYFEFPSAIAVDPDYHGGFVQYILDCAHIQATVSPDANLKCLNMPVFHLLVTALSLSSGMSVHDSYFFVGIIECVSVAFVFLIGKAVLNARSGLFAALLLVLTSYFLLWSIHITPLSLGVVTTLILLVFVCERCLHAMEQLRTQSSLAVICFALVSLAFAGAADGTKLKT